MNTRRAVTAALPIGALSLAGTATADEGRQDGQSRNTRADYTPFEAFEPVPSSSACTGALDDPFVLPPGSGQQVLAREGEGGSKDLWDMNTQNESGTDAGRYVYRTHEVGPGTGPQQGSQVTVTDLKTGVTRILAERPDWERFDGIVWTPWDTILAAEETSAAAATDPQVAEATGGLVYELFVDPTDPSRLDPGRERITAPADGTTDTTKDGLRARPALGSKSHEGQRFDKQGNYYGISESNPGGIFGFVPDRKGDLSKGQLSVLRTGNGQDGEGAWVPISEEEARVQAQAAATGRGNGYNRPEDVETGESTGVDRNNGGDTLYVAVTETDDVLAVDLRRSDRPYAYFYVDNQPRPTNPTPNATAELDFPDNLALDRRGNLVVAEDPGGTPPAKTQGDDVWIAAPPESGRHRPASTVQRFATLKDCVAEPTGPYFALQGTEKFTEGTPRERLVHDETLFVNRQHAGQGTTLDQLVAIAEPREDDDDGDDD